LGIAWNRNFERLDKPFEIAPGVKIAPGGYDFGEAVLNYISDPTATLFADGNFAVGSFYAGTIRTINFNGGVRRGQNLTWTGGWLKNFIRLPEGNFNTDLVGLRFNWSFTPKSYLQAFTQYNSQIKEWSANLRLALLSTSSTGLFVVYTTRGATTDFLDPHAIHRRTLSRALLIKFNYLLDF